MDIFNDDLDILNVIEHGFPRRIYDRHNYFEEMDNLSFYRRFRITKDTCLNTILPLIEEELEYPSNKNNSVSPMNQLLVTLRFYASAGFLISLGDFGGMHTSTVSRIIARVSALLAGLRPQFIKLPETNADLVAVKQGFFSIARFPKVMGAIDGTHVKIQSPGGDDAEIFRNRKSYFSLNVQAVTNHNLEFLDIVARWPGSTHDSTIYNNSRLKFTLETEPLYRDSILLGDSGYPLRPYFLTPLLNPTTPAEQLYNESHIRTRNTVERLFGNWKRRFPVLAYGLRLKMETTLAVIVACAVLQNIARRNNEPEPPPAENLNQEDLNQLINQGNIPQVPVGAVDAPNLNYRRQLIENYFNIL